MKQFILIFFAGIFLFINTEHIHARLHHNDSISTVLDKSDDSSNDALLDKYESMLDEMVLILKAVKAGDAEAQQKYAIWQEESEPFLRNLASRFENFTPEQMKRLNDKAEKISAEIDALSRSNVDRANSNNNLLEEKEYTVSECNIALEKYESWVDRYIVVYSKALAGEADAVVEMQSMAEEVDAITGIISACSSKYSKDDIDRIQRISDKLVKSLPTGD
jgi:hypothetical protein